MTPQSALALAELTSVGGGQRLRQLLFILATEGLETLPQDLLIFVALPRFSMDEPGQPFKGGERLA